MARQPSEPVGPGEFASFMRAYQDMVFTTAARITGNDRQAEDIAQDVFLKAYESFERLRTSVAAGGWLKTVARNMSLNYVFRHRRRRRLFSELRREDRDDEPDIELASPDDLLAELDADTRRELVEQAMKSLPERQRVPLALYHYEDLSYEEIAAHLHVSLAKVKTDIFRARAALAKLLTSRGVSAQTALPSP